MEYERRGVPSPLHGWIATNMKGLAQQVNGDDCGVFVCMFARRICEGASCLFDANTAEVRYRMMLEILRGSVQTLPIRDSDPKVPPTSLITEVCIA